MVASFKAFSKSTAPKTNEKKKMNKKKKEKTQTNKNLGKLL
jgi:hypothetical protein